MASKFDPTEDGTQSRDQSNPQAIRTSESLHRIAEPDEKLAEPAPRILQPVDFSLMQARYG